MFFSLVSRGLFQPSKMSGCLVRSPVELRRFVVQQELNLKLVQPPSPFHALRNGTGSPATTNCASTRSASKSASSSEQSTARARSPFAHSPKGSARGISSARSSARAKLKEPRAQAPCASDSSTSASCGVQPDDSVRPSPVPRSLVARYDASLGNHRKAEAMRKERSERTAARATQATLQREHAQNTVRSHRQLEGSISTARQEVQQRNAAQAEAQRQQEALWKMARAQEDRTLLADVKERVGHSRSLEEKLLEHGRIATVGHETVGIKTVGGPTGGIGGSSPASLFSVDLMSHEQGKGRSQEEALPGKHEHARRKMQQLTLNRERAATQRAQNNMRCQAALSAVEGLKRASAEGGRQDAACRQHTLQQLELQRLQRAQEGREARHAHRAEAQRELRQRCRRRRLEALEEEKAANAAIAQARHEAWASKRGLRNRVFAERYASASAAGAFVESSPFLDLYLMDEVAHAKIAEANRRLLERLSSARPRTDYQIDQVAAAEAREEAAAPAAARRRAEEQRIERENAMMKERLRHPRRTDWVGWSLDGEQGNEEAGGHDEERPRYCLSVCCFTLLSLHSSPHQWHQRPCSCCKRMEDPSSTPSTPSRFARTAWQPHSNPNRALVRVNG